MKQLVEIGKDGRRIVWQPHLLTEALAVAHPPHNELSLEPLPGPADGSASLFNVKSEGGAINWSWGPWARVEVRAETAEGRPTGARTYTTPQPPSVSWQELPASAAVEVTFYDADGDAAGCVKVEVPDAAGFGRDVDFSGPHGNAVLVTLRNSRSDAGIAVECRVVGQRRGQLKEYPLRGNPVRFAPGQTRVSVPIPSYFAGIIAVTRDAGGRRQLLAYRHFDDYRRLVLPDLSRALGVEELNDLRHWVEKEAGDVGPARPRRELTAEEWLANWPSDSQRRLMRLIEQAQRCADLSEEDAYMFLRMYPAGLLRFLALVCLGYESRSPAWLIRRLDGGSFQAALDATFPGLGAALPQLVAPAERAWAVVHADNANVAEAAAEAAGRGVNMLKRALHLLDVRAAAHASWEARRHAHDTTLP